MSIYVRLNAAGRIERADIELTDKEFAALQANGKAASLRRWISTPSPEPKAGQVIEQALPVIAADTATEAWTVRARTALETDLSEQAAEREEIGIMVDAIGAQLNISSAAFNAMTNAQKLDTLRDDRRLVLRGLRLILRTMRHGL